MHENSPQRSSGAVSPIYGTDDRSEHQQFSIRLDDSLANLAVSVPNHLMTEDYVDNPETASRAPEPRTQDASVGDSTSLLAEQSADIATATAALTTAKPAATFAILGRRWIHVWGSASIDILGAAASLFFLVIAVLSLSLNEDPVSARGQDIKAITLVSPTIFPIVYAAILGRLLRKIGLFKAERGSTIGTLEQLIGSQSVFSRIERQFGLRRMDLLGVVIVTAWLLSPLGGQASLRLLSTRMSEKTIDAAIHYHTLNTFPNSTMLGPEMQEKNWALYAPLFMSTLQFARQNFNQPRDLFGNVRIPDMASLTTRDDVSDSEWYNVSDSSSLWFTSLLGNPVVGIPSSGNLTFMIESSYWEVRCGSWKTQNLTMPGPGGSVLRVPLQQGPSFELRVRPVLSTVDTHSDFRNITKAGSLSFVNEEANCAAILRAVQSDVDCQGGTCEVQRMQTSSRSASILPMLMAANQTNHRSLFEALCASLPRIGMGERQNFPMVPELVEQWIWDPSLWNIIPSSVDWQSVNITDLSLGTFTQRFQMALNTFWDSTLGFNYMATNATSQVREYDGTISTPWTEVRAQGTDRDVEGYVCNIIFAIITIVISLLLFAAAVTSAFLGFITKAPDILSYVSSLARDNPHFGQAVPSYHSGMQAARALRDVWVRIGDVRSDDEVGHIAFATSKEIHPEGVSRNRSHD